MSLRLRLLWVMALLTVVPALSAGILSRRLTGQAFDLGLSTEVDAALEAGVRRARAQHREARKALDDAAGELLSRLEAEGIEGWKDGIEVPVADRIEWTRQGTTEVLQAGEPASPAASDVPAAIEVVQSSPSGTQLRWNRPVNDDWRTDAEHLASTLQLVRGLQAERESFERTFWVPYLVIYGLALVAGLFAAWRVSRGITGPVNTLLSGTDAVTAGRWDVELPVHGGSEISVLTARFNTMVRTLDAQSRRLVDLETMAGWREMARALAHEVKNPLTPIQLTVEEMRERYQGSDEGYRSLLKECSRIVVEEVESLRSVVTRFREFSRPVELERREQDVARLMRDVGALQRDMEVVVDVEPELRAAIDEDRFRQMLMNLCENSRKAMESSPQKRLRLTGRREGDQVQLRVEDAGPGIPPQERARVFEPYRTGSGGLGLGLALVKGIVLAHDGSIDVDTSEWGGARFLITLPTTAKEMA